jgi:ferredoxin
MIVMDEDNCMVDVARYFLDFLRDESCGKCVTCREGLQQMYLLVDRMCKGVAKPGDIELLEELGETVADASLCALGQTAPNPVLSTLRYFREEYEAHVYRESCPAHVCKPLIRFAINEKCNGCHVCARKCPEECITGAPKERHVIDDSRCVRCRICFESCKFEAIDILTGDETSSTAQPVSP